MTEPASVPTRLERIYKALTGEETERGARAWFARLNNVQPYTVTRWCDGLAPSAVLAHLDTLEQLILLREEAGKVEARHKRVLRGRDKKIDVLEKRNAKLESALVDAVLPSDKVTVGA